MSKDKIKTREAKENYETANKHAEQKYNKSIEELAGEIREDMNSQDFVTRRNGIENGRKLVEELSLLMLYQEVTGTRGAGYLNFGNRFDDGYITQGNAKQYMVDYDLGYERWDPTKFVPTEVSTTDADEWLIQMYHKKSSGSGIELSPQAYQFKKEKVIREVDWIPFFQSGKLSQFLGILRSEIRRTYDMYKYDKIAKLITSSSPQTTITSNGKDMFECMIDFLQEVRKSLKYNTKYNYKNQKYLNFCEASDLIVIMNYKTIQRLQSGVLSQLYNSHMLNLKGILDDENLMDLGNKLNVPMNPKQAITVTDEAYVDENTIWVVHKDAIKHITQIDTGGSQAYPENLTVMLVEHIWGAVDILPWGIMWKFTAENLNKLPE